MSERLTDEEIEEIRGRAEAASYGPWCVGSNNRAAQVLPAKDGKPVGIDTICAVQVSNCPRWREDAQFIANARTDIPRLLDEVERLREENDRYRESLEEIAGGEYQYEGPIAMNRAIEALEATDE